MFFLREMPSDESSPESSSHPKRAVRSKRMSKHIVQRAPRSGSHSIPSVRANQPSLS
jgi:hypothetical protein